MYKVDLKQMLKKRKCLKSNIKLKGVRIKLDFQIKMNYNLFLKFVVFLVINKNKDFWVSLWLLVVYMFRNYF